MASIEVDKVIRIIDRMIEKARAKGKKKRRLALIVVRDGYMAEVRRREYGDCNTCEVRRCPMKPPVGGQVRNNCPHYKGPDKVEKGRGRNGHA